MSRLLGFTCYESVREWLLQRKAVIKSVDLVPQSYSAALPEGGARLNSYSKRLSWVRTSGGEKRKHLKSQFRAPLSYWFVGGLYVSGVSFAFLPPENHYKEKLQRRCCQDGLRAVPMPYSCTRRSYYITEGWECIRAFRYCCSTYRNQELDTAIPTTFPPTTTPLMTTSAPTTTRPPMPTYPYFGFDPATFQLQPYSRQCNYGS